MQSLSACINPMDPRWVCIIIWWISMVILALVGKYWLPWGALEPSSITSSSMCDFPTTRTTPTPFQSSQISSDVELCHSVNHINIDFLYRKAMRICYYTWQAQFLLLPRFLPLSLSLPLIFYLPLHELRMSRLSGFPKARKQKWHFQVRECCAGGIVLQHAHQKGREAELYEYMRLATDLEGYLVS